jgi:hypothetical protein
MLGSLGREPAVLSLLQMLGVRDPNAGGGGRAASPDMGGASGASPGGGPGEEGQSVT